MMRRHQRGQTLILIALGALLLGGSAAAWSLLPDNRSVEHLRHALRERIPDQARRRLPEGVLDRVEAGAKRHQSELDKLGRDLLGVLERHDATRAELDALLARADAVNAQARQQLLDLRFELRSMLTDEDWRALFAARAP